MLVEQPKEDLIECYVTYTVHFKGELMMIENVPARVNQETGEELFSPQTVERLQQVLWKQNPPKRIIKVPVFEFT